MYTGDAFGEAPDRRSTRLILGAVAATMFLASMGQTIVSPALPTIIGELGGIDHLTWVVTAFLLSSTVVAPIYGKLGDLYGRKIALQVAILIFLAGATLSALASSMTFLIVARAVQGLGGGGLMVVTMAVVADVIPPRQRGRVQGFFGAVFGVAAVAGPLLGGFIVQHFSWRWIFIINLPLGFLALAVIGIALQPRADRVPHKIDYAGFILLSGTLSALVLATSLGGTTFPWGSMQIVGLFVIAISLLIAFAIAETRAAEPVLPLSLFRNNTFVVSNCIAFLVGMTMFGSITFLPLFLQIAKGVTPTGSALQLVPMMAGLIGTSSLSGLFMSRTGRYRVLPIFATAVLFVGLVLLARMGAATPSWQISLYTLLVGIGIGPVNSVAVTAIQNAVPRDMVGVATAGATMFRQIGGSIGVAAFGAIFSAALTLRLGAQGGKAIDPGTVATLPDPLRMQVVDSFAAALHPVFLTAAGIALIAFVVSFLLRELPLSETLRGEPGVEANAGDAGASAVVGAPPTPSR